MHDEAVAASSQLSDTFGRYLPYESADSYGPTEVTDGGYYLAELTLERRLVAGFRGGGGIKEGKFIKEGFVL
jgi:hypothetical protein